MKRVTGHDKGKATRTASLILVSVACVHCAAKEEPIQIGVNIELGGELGAAGASQLQTMNLAISEINAAGGVAGRPLSLVVKDNATSAEGAGARMSEFTGMGDIAAVLGPEFSGGLKLVVPIAKASEMVVISAGSTAPSLVPRDDGGFVFRDVANDAFQGKAMAYYLRTLMQPLAESVAVIYQEDNYGIGLKDSFRADFERRGGTILGTPISFTPGLDTTAKVDAVFGQIVGLAPKMIVVIAFSGDTKKLVEKWDDSGQLRDLRWFFSDSSRDSGLATARPAALEGMQGTAPTHEKGPAWDEFVAAFDATYHQDISQTVYAANSYDSAYLVALGLALQHKLGTLANGKLGGAGLRDAIRTIAAAPPVESLRASQWAEAMRQIEAGSEVNFDGAGSPCDFDAQNEVLGPYEVWKIVLDGTQGKIVEERVLAVSDFAAGQ